MKRYLLLFFSLLPFIAAAQPPNDSVVAKIILIGDAGALTADFHHTVVEAVEKVERMDDKTTVVYLGDNLYRHGLPYEQMINYKATRAVLDSQINIADHGPRMVYFIPGNHDWMNQQPGGYDAAIRQERYIESVGKKNVKFLPRDGCPGPEEIQLGNDVVLILMNTQWWLHPNYKPGIESDCDNKTREELLGDLQDIVTRNHKKLIIFAAHHPFKSNGIHGGYFKIKQYFFPFTDIKKNLYIPLPILGAVYPISRSVFGSLEDLKFPDYQNMITQIDKVLQQHPNVIHVAGHEHALEWIADSNSNYIVSGSGCKTSRVSKSRRANFVADKLGWATLSIYKNKTVDVTFYGADSPGQVLHTGRVLDYSRLPVEEKADSTTPIHVDKDSVLVRASAKYDNATATQLLLDGRNYRDEWTEPVSLKVFHLESTHGGFTITGAGGGFQTKSLHLVDRNKRRYNLRTVDKNPEKVLPTNMRETFARDVVQDMISAAHPYAPLAIWPMADAADIIAPRPEFYFVPDDPGLGQYRSMFRFNVCILEPADPTPDASETKSSAKVINRIISTDDHFVDQKAVLRARLLDMMIGDWDRHLDQWRWGVGDTGKGKLYYPIPRDRDQAFFNSDGLIMKFATRRRIPWMSGFKDNLRRFKWLSHSPRDFDRFFMNELTKADWESGTKYFQSCETDSIIHFGISQMPAPIVAIGGPVLERKLRNRRDQLLPRVMKYYRFLSKEVVVLGSNRDEFFNFREVDSGLQLQVYAREKDKGKDTTRLRYSRLFDPKVTKEIRMFGFGGADRFNIEKNVNTNTRLRMIGGGGIDTFNVEGKAHSHIYDVTTEQNQVLAKRHTYNEFSLEASVNDYKVQDFSYNFLRFPTIAFGYNPEDGILLGAGAWRRTYGFRKEPYETDNKLTSLFALGQKAFQLKYRGTFVHSIRDFDVLLNGDLQRPALRNFFGYGNETKIEKDLDFYRARYNFITGDILLQKRLFGIVRMAVGPTYYYYSNHEYSNDRKVLENPAYVGLDSANIYTHKQYLGGKLFFDVNNVNNDLFPTRGVSWRSEFNAFAGLSGKARPFTEFHSDMDIYASLADPAKLVAVLRFGGGHIFSKDFEFFQSMAVGQNNYLRGFRKNRFSGRSMAYNSIELRAKLFTVKSYILPGAFGLVGFNDVARVWSDDEHSRKWHDSYGGGIYYIPFNMFMVSATTAFSSEEMLFNVTIGTKLNLTF